MCSKHYTKHYGAEGVGDGSIRHCVHFGLPRRPVLIFEGFLDIEHDKEGTPHLPPEVEFETRLTKLGLYGVREIRDRYAPVKFVIRWLPNPLPTKDGPKNCAAPFKRFYLR